MRRGAHGEFGQLGIAFLLFDRSGIAAIRKLDAFGLTVFACRLSSFRLAVKQRRAFLFANFRFPAEAATTRLQVA